MIFATDIDSALIQLEHRKFAAVAGIVTTEDSPASRLAYAMRLPLLHVKGRTLNHVRSAGRPTSGLVLFVDSSGSRLDRIRLPGLRVCLKETPAQQPASNLHVLLVPDSAAWTGPARGGLYSETLAGLGIESIVLPARPDVIATMPPACVIWNHALVADVPKLVTHAARTGAQLVNVNHSSHAFLAHTPGSLRRWLDSCEAARQHSHVWSVSQCEMPPVTGCDRIRQVSCPVRLHEPRPYRPPHSPLRIAVAGRCCPTKNLTNSLLAISRLQQVQPIELHMCVDPSQELQRTLDLLNLHPSRLGQLGHDDWLQYLRFEADLLLQVSLTESYNMAATEAQQIGVPTIASATVHAADPELTVSDPNNTEQIAAKIQQAAQDYRNYTLRAHQHGRASADRRNAEYAAFVETLKTTPGLRNR